MDRHPWNGVRRGASLLGVLGLVLLPAGCGGRTYPVDGQVVFPGGAPATQLAGYTVTFESEEPRVSATGVVRPDGTFRVGTDGVDDGAVPGKHRAAINPPVPDGDVARPKSRIRTKYERLETSGLEVTITRGRNQVTLEVEPAER